MPRIARCCCGALRADVTGEVAACSHLSLHGVPAAYRLGLRRCRLFPERAGARRGAEQGLRAPGRLGAKSRVSLLSRLWHLGVLVRGIPPGSRRHRYWRVRRSVDIPAGGVGVGGNAASVGDL